MQCILGIDLSSQPCEFTLSQVDGFRIEVIQRTTVRLPLFANKSLLRSADIRRLLSPQEAAPVPAGDNTAEELAPAEETESELARQTVADLRQAIQSLQPIWTASTVILPQFDHLSLNLDLPFGDPRNLDRIVDLEVQDVVPFELDEFFVQYSSLGPVIRGAGPGTPATPQSQGGQFDVHIGILPRQLVRNVLDICKAAGLEPNILTVPSSAVGAAFHVGKQFFTSNSALIYNRGDEYVLALYINGEVRVERSIYASQLLSAVSPEKREENLQHIFTAIKLLLASSERRYNASIERVYLLGREVKNPNSQQVFGRPLEGMAFKELFKSEEPQVGLAPLSSVFALDEAEKMPLSNFRSREFSFTPRIGEFLRALAGAKRHALRAVVAVIVALAAIYGSREYTLASSRSALVEYIQKVIPGFPSDASDIRSNLMKAENKLADELGAFGSRASISPVDAFLDLVKTLPDSSDLSISSLKVSGIRAQISGSANDLAATERFQKALSARKEIFAKVEGKSTRVGTRFNFTIDIVLTQ
jgi:hypothetical protein